MPQRILKQNRAAGIPLIDLDALLDHTPVKHVDGAFGMTREARVMRDHADGRAFTVQIAQQVHYCFGVAGIQVSGWFVR